MNAPSRASQDGMHQDEIKPLHSSVIIFPLRGAEQTNSSRKRSKFNSERRRQVKNVRKRGACMRCRLLKIKCSDDDLCTTCVQAAKISHNHEKRVLGFVSCVRTSLLDVSIFPHGNCAPTIEASNGGITDLTSLASLVNQRDLFRPSWLGEVIEQGHLGNTNTLSTAFVQANFLDDLPMVFYTFLYANFLDDLPMIFHTFLYQMNLSALDSAAEVLEFDCDLSGRQERAAVMGLAENTESHSSVLLHRESNPKNLKFTAFTGHQYLKILERLLRPSFLSSCTLKRLRAIFFMVFGTTLTVGLADPAVALPPFPDDGPMRTGNSRTLYDVLRNHLCQMLTHYMAFIGSKLGYLESVQLNKNLEARDWAESIGLWERGLLVWIMHWENRNFDQHWLKTWSSFLKGEFSCSLDSGD